jgi:hypothetical protein
MKRTTEILINFEFKVDEKVEFHCKKNSDNSSCEIDLFRIENSCFLYLCNKNPKVRTCSLREIGKEEFELRKKDLLSRRPQKHILNWSDDVGNILSLKTFVQSQFSRTLAYGACIFLTENPLKSLVEAVIESTSLQEEHRTSVDRQAKKEYAQKCGAISNRYGVSFVNVLRIGPDVASVKRFKEAYENLCENVTVLPPVRQRQIYDAFFRGDGRKARENIMNELSIPFFGADVSAMEFIELEQILKKSLSEYIDDYEKYALENCEDLSYNQALEIYEKLLLNNRSKKKEALAALGIDIECININAFSTKKIQQRLAEILGINN